MFVMHKFVYSQIEAIPVITILKYHGRNNIDKHKNKSSLLNGRVVVTYGYQKRYRILYGTLKCQRTIILKMLLQSQHDSIYITVCKPHNW